MSENGSGHKTLIMLGVFLAVFFFLAGQIPSMFFTIASVTESDYTDYTTVVIDDWWNVGEIATSNITFTSTDNGSLSYLQYLYLHLTKVETGDTEIVISWLYDSSLNERVLRYFHTHTIIAGILYMYYPMEPYPIQISFIEDHLVQGTNVSQWTVSCRDNDLSVWTQVMYNDTTYSSMREAWNAGELASVFVGMGYNSTGPAIEVHYQAWNWLWRVLLFQAPNIHPVLNYVIAVPIWVSVGAIFIYIVDRVKPFG